MATSTDPPATAAPRHPGRLPSRRMLGWEVVLVFALSLGQSGVYALLNLIRDLASRAALHQQHTSPLVASEANQHWLDLIYQLVGIGFALVPVALVAYFLSRSGESLHDIGFDARQPRRDLSVGVGLAALVGGAGLGLYLAAYGLGINLNVVAEDLPAVWWRVPVLLLSAAHDGLLEEILVVGYLLRRLRQLGWGDGRALVTSAVVRGSYHLYQGFGGFLGNAVMGLLFGRIYQRRGRTMPLVIAHTLIDSVAFVGYALLHGKVSWLP